MANTAKQPISEEKRRMREILRNELENMQIAVRRWKRNGGGGHANFGLEYVDIPRPANTYLLGVAFHEMGHIYHKRLDPAYTSMPEYMIEYMAERYAIKKLIQYRLQCDTYKLYAVRYVLSCIATYKNGGGSVDDVPLEVREWTGMNFAAWRDSQLVIVRRDNTIRCFSDIDVKYFSDGSETNNKKTI